MAKKIERGEINWTRLEVEYLVTSSPLAGASWRLEGVYDRKTDAVTKALLIIADGKLVQIEEIVR